MKITNHVSYREVTFSQTATRRGIDNSPNEEQLANIQLLCAMVFEPLREWAGGAIKINSCFRSDALNKAIGGANSSQHCANNGAAMDIDDNFGTKTNAEMFHYIKDNLAFDQLIAEFPENGAPSWVHVSYKKEGNRKEVLVAVRKKGRVVYAPYDEKDGLVNPS